MLVAAAAGALFGIGLVVSGMADPARVLAFLTVGPGWNPSLAFVMAGALAITLPGFALLRWRGQPLLAGSLSKPPSRQLDRSLIAGALIFGVGWGLAGYCPGPGIVGAALVQPGALIFVAFMLLGGWRARSPRKTA